ncbi:MAG: hypothetical protein ACT4OM_07240 [Actinomycetota bacterium]
MTKSVGFCALGMPFSVACADSAVICEVSRLLETFRVDTAGRARHYRLDCSADGSKLLLRDGKPVARSSSWDGAIRALVVHVNAEAIGFFDGLAIHAGAVARDSEVSAFPGPSGLGKSTLTAACLVKDFCYVSDEALCLDSSGGVVAYPKPISLDASSVALLDLRLESGDSPGERLLVYDELGSRLARPPLRLGHIVRLCREDGPARLSALPRSEGLACLVQMSFNHYKNPRRAFELAHKLASECRCWQLSYSHPADGAQVLSSQLPRAS